MSHSYTHVHVYTCTSFHENLMQLSVSTKGDFRGEGRGIASYMCIHVLAYTCTCIYMHDCTVYQCAGIHVHVRVCMGIIGLLSSGCFGSMYLHWFLIHIVYCLKLLSEVVCFASWLRNLRPQLYCMPTKHSV